MTQLASFAAGCFWGVEDFYRRVPGVIDVISGYTGGTTKNPTYEQIHGGRTGHAEAVQITFDPEKTTYEKLLDLFWMINDPTQVNRQGPNIGSYYRSAIFCHSPEQKTIAENSRATLAASGKYSKPIATEIVDATTFWKAEEHHQRFVEKNGYGACHAV